jgi:hypothetical protein
VIVRAAVCASPPLLARGVGGQADVLPELRAECEAAVAWLLAAAPDAVTVIGPATTTATWPPDSVPDLTMHAPGLARLPNPAPALSPQAQRDDPRQSQRTRPTSALEPAPPARPAPPVRPAPRLPLSLAIGAQLLDAAGYAGPRVLQSIAESASPAACRDLGHDLAADAPLTGLLVMGDGTARRSAAAPGYLDERAQPFDTAVEQAFRDGDLPALAALDPDLARDLLATGRPAWQVLVGALAPAPAPALRPDSPQDPPAPSPTPVARVTSARPRTRVLYSDAPLGVAYLVVTLDPTP